MSEFSVTIRVRIALHEGGTKFYETLLLTRPDADIGVLYRHYGKKEQVRGAGMSKIDRFDYGTSMKEEGALWTKKGKRGEYTQPMGEPLEHGFFNSKGPHCLGLNADRTAVVGIKIESVEALREALKEHKVDKTSIETIISDLEGRDSGYDPVGVIVEDPNLTDVPATRGDDWGQW